MSHYTVNVFHISWTKVIHKKLQNIVEAELKDLSNTSPIENLTEAEVILMIDDLGSELDTSNLRSIVKKIIETGKQTILTGIEGEEIQISIKDLANFTQINL